MFLEKSQSLMGTIIRCGLEHPDSELLLEQAFDKLAYYEKTFSANDASSVLMVINQQAGVGPVQVPSDLFDLIDIGRQASLDMSDLLNIAIGPLIKLWHVGFADAKRPTDAQIQAVLPLINPEKIQLNPADKTVYLTEQGMEIDLGALAKGYFADKIIDFFKAQGASAGFIDLGGNVLTFGAMPKNETGMWQIGIQNPALPRGHYARVLKIKNLSVVTSGIYERQLSADGQDFHHIFDSRTGYPVQSDLASLTIISEKSLDGEIWTTKLFGKSAAQVIAQVNQIDGIEALVITKDNQMAWTHQVTNML